jgi:hypothetical protein
METVVVAVVTTLASFIGSYAALRVHVWYLTKRVQRLEKRVFGSELA